MNKNLLYGVLVVVVIIAFTIIWKNSQKEEMSREVNTAPETTLDERVKIDTPALITEDLNKIDLDSGIDIDLKAIDEDLSTL